MANAETVVRSKTVEEVKTNLEGQLVELDGKIDKLAAKVDGLTARRSLLVALLEKVKKLDG